jgi:prepilin-type N-terminal cleavage/methylation domain-containing protein
MPFADRDDAMGVQTMMKTINRVSEWRGLCCSERGFSLVELMIVGAIIGIAGLIAAPNFLVWKSRSELKQAVTEVANLLTEAKVVAQSRNTPVTVTISLLAGEVRATMTNSATGAALRTAISSQVPHVRTLMIGPSSGWTSAPSATVSFTSIGTRSGGPGLLLNQELALVNDQGLQYAVKVPPRGITTWCQQSVCL